MKQNILFLFLIFFSLKVAAKKMEFPLTVIAASADLIVIGEIDIVKNNSYTFKINETLKGQTYKTISVKMFEEWTCDNRFEKAKKGQKLFLFLKKDSNNWTIINGSSGELFISNNSIYLGGEDSMLIVNHKISRNPKPLTEYKNAIRDFCKCYIFVGKFGYYNNEPQYFKQICSDKQVSEFKNRSKLSTWLFDKMKNCTIKKITTKSSSASTSIPLMPAKANTKAIIFI